MLRITNSGAGGTLTFATDSNTYLTSSSSLDATKLTGASGMPEGINDTLSLSTYLSYTAGTTYDGSTSRTIQTNATSANTVSTLVARDASGNFTAGTITAALTGTASGNLTSSSSLDPANVSQTASYRFVTDTEKST